MEESDFVWVNSGTYSQLKGRTEFQKQGVVTNKVIGELMGVQHWKNKSGSEPIQTMLFGVKDDESAEDIIGLLIK